MLWRDFVTNFAFIKLITQNRHNGHSSTRNSRIGTHGIKDLRYWTGVLLTDVRETIDTPVLKYLLVIHLALRSTSSHHGGYTNNNSPL